GETINGPSQETRACKEILIPRVLVEEDGGENMNGKNRKDIVRGIQVDIVLKKDQATGKELVAS
ncbi:DUF2196 domain-containing protein, partial [Effusibacillus consociatus]